MTQFISLPYSPWSEKARWALDHHRIERRDIGYVPMLGEPYLRYKLGRFTGRVTVPVLLDEMGVWADSFDIAKRADTIGSSPKLFPEGAEAEIRRWNALSEEVLAASRVLSLRRCAESPAAIQEMLPPFFPRALRPHLIPVGQNAVRFMTRKYSLNATTDAAAEATIRAGLERLASALEGAGGYLLEGRLSYADIVMAVAMQLVAPVDDRYIRLGPETRKRCTVDPLVAKFAGLVKWRDELYQKHR